MADPHSMTDLPKPLRARLAEAYSPLAPASVATATSGGVAKHLMALSDGNCVECVAMAHRWGLSACLSSQVGCAVRCRFCASGADGYIRNLSPEEIAGQALLLHVAEGAPSRVVLMGMGEPLLNTRAVLEALRLICDGIAFSVPERQVTISTVGVVRGIEALARSGRRARLAVSVHAADPHLRAELIPNQPDDITAVVRAAESYAAIVRRRPTYEYVLLGGVNDRTADALALCRLLPAGAHVNLIPLSAVRGSPFTPSGDAAARRFGEVLRSRGVNVCRRRSVGRGVEAGCGQLRLRSLGHEARG